MALLALGTVRAVVAPGPDRGGRRGRLLLVVVIGSLLGAVAVVYGLLTSRWASVVVGAVLLVVAGYCAVVLWGLRRRDPS
jgi:ABC-type Mn2+/Zn2+ transport system permease subunit